MTLKSQKTGLLLAGLALLIIVGRLLTYHEPIERDLSTYVVFGHGLLNGRELYSDLWEHKPPGVYLSYAAAEWLVGYGKPAVFLLNIATALTSLVAIFFAAGIWGALFWAIFCGDLYTLANQPNTEAFINACVLAVFAIVSKTASRRQIEYAGGTKSSLRQLDAGYFLMVGALLALGSLYKHLALVYGAFLAGAYLLLAFKPFSKPDRTSDREQTTRFKQILLSISIVTATWLALFAYFYFTDRWRVFYDTVFGFNRFYKGYLKDNLLSLFHPPFIFFTALTAGYALMAIAGFGFVAGFKKNRAFWLLWLAYAGATVLSIILPGHYHVHYYQLWIPVLCAGAGMAVGECFHAAKKNRKKNVLAGTLASAAVLNLLVVELPLYFKPAAGWSEIKYGPVFIEIKRTAEEIKKLLKPGETFYHWGSEAGLYHYAQIDPPTGPLWNYALKEGPMRHELCARVAADLRRVRPELVVLGKNEFWENKCVPTGGNAVMDFVLSHYRPLANFEIGNRYFWFYALKGGALEARLRNSL